MLLLFSATERCVKCGWREIEMKFVRGVRSLFALAAHEALKCRCKRCDHTWYCECADAKPAPVSWEEAVERG